MLGFFIVSALAAFCYRHRRLLHLVESDALATYTLQVASSDGTTVKKGFLLLEMQVTDHGICAHNQAYFYRLVLLLAYEQWSDLHRHHAKLKLVVESLVARLPKFSTLSI